MIIFPSRRWVQSADGWVSRPVTFADNLRRKHLETSLSRGIDDEQRAWERGQAEHWESVTHTLDRVTATRT